VLEPTATRIAERGVSNWKDWMDRGKDDFVVVVVVGGLHSRFIADRMPWGLFEATQNRRQVKFAYVIVQSRQRRMCKTCDCRDGVVSLGRWLSGYGLQNSEDP
jgi:hypothetical protein